MKRREFLKLAGAAVAAVMLPEIAVDAARARSVGQTWTVKRDSGYMYSDELRRELTRKVRENHWHEFDPAYAHGNGVLLRGKPGPQATAHFAENLYEDMRKWVPPAFRHRVQIVGPIEVDYGHSAQIAWRYIPA